MCPVGITGSVGVRIIQCVEFGYVAILNIGHVEVACGAGGV